MGPVAKFFLWLFIILSLISGSIYGTYDLHKRHIIEVRIPKPLRKGWFKDYISPEEKAEIEREKEKQKQIEIQKELNIRKSIKPTHKGFKIEDSMFKEDEEVEFQNPNEGFSQYQAVSHFIVVKPE